MILVISCSVKYEVVQRLALNKYHVVGVKTKDVIIIENVTLTPGQVIKWRDVKRGKYAKK